MSGTLRLPPHFLTAVSLHDGGYLETGGFLFARPTAPHEVIVASGPGHKSERTRDTIALDRKGVDEAATAAGLVVCGCWHSHLPGKHGIEPSPEDRTAWRGELARSQGLDAWRGVIVLRARGRSETIGAWVTRRSGTCEPVPLPPITDQTRAIAQEFSFGMARGPLAEPPSKWEPGALHRELARLDREHEISERVRQQGLNARLRALGYRMPDPAPLTRSPAAVGAGAASEDVAAAGEILDPPRKQSVAAAARNLDRELLDWLSAAPEGLDQDSYERMVAVAQRAVAGRSIFDDVNAGVR